MSKDKAKIQKILTDNNNRINRDVAEQILDAIALDGVYSPDEKSFMGALRENEEIAYTRGTEAYLNKGLSRIAFKIQRDAAHAAKLASLDKAILSAAGSEEIGQAQAEAILGVISATGYGENQQKTMHYLYAGERMTDDAKAWLKDKIAHARAARAHKAWVAKSADQAIAGILGDNFMGVAIDHATAIKLFDAIAADGQYSSLEKKTMANLYRNASWGEGAKEFLVDEIHEFTSGMSLDGEVVDAFMTTIDEQKGDKVITADEIAPLLELLNLSDDLSSNRVRTVEYCIQTFPCSDDVQTQLETALESAQDKRGAARVEAAKKVTEAAEKEEVIEDKSTATKIVPSRTLMAEYNKLKNKRGQITARTAEEFAEAVVRRGYTPQKQATMRLLRGEGAFTRAANEDINLVIRRYVAKKNFGQ